MQVLGNDVYIQRGETWSLDFTVRNSKGDPLMLFKGWNNPYLAITVTAARYAQKGDFRRTWWLDLQERFVEQKDGSLLLVPVKKFMATEALALDIFSISSAIAIYGNEGRIVLDKNSDFDITNFLFFTDPRSDNNRIYKYVESYEIASMYSLLTAVWSADTVYNIGDIVKYNSTIYYVTEITSENEKPVSDDGTPNAKFLALIVDDLTYNVSNHYKDGTEYSIGTCTIYTDDKIYVAKKNTSTIPTTVEDWYVIGEGKYAYIGDGVVEEIWTEYDFRVIKQFSTKEWTEQGYLYDVKVLAGESIEEHVYGILLQQGDDVPELPWNEQELQQYINEIYDEETREYVQSVYDAGMPLMPDYDTKMLVLKPTNLYVSANIQGGL